MENNNTNPATETKEVLKITLKKPASFDAVGDIKITTTTELSKIINDIFAQVFADYYGCSLKVQFQPERQAYIVVPKLFFKVMKTYDDNKIYAFRTLGANKANDDMIGRVQRVSQSAASGSKALITDDGKSVLEDFLITPAVKANNFDWNSAFSTIATETDTFVQVYKLDINKLISTIFGDHDETGSKQYYQITPTGVVGTANQYKNPDNWSLFILRLNHVNEAYAAELLGFNIPAQSSMPTVITETTRK